MSFRRKCSRVGPAFQVALPCLLTVEQQAAETKKYDERQSIYGPAKITYNDCLPYIAYSNHKKQINYIKQKHKNEKNLKNGNKNKENNETTIINNHNELIFPNNNANIDYEITHELFHNKFEKKDDPSFDYNAYVSDCRELWTKDEIEKFEKLKMQLKYEHWLKWYFYFPIFF